MSEYKFTHISATHEGGTKFYRIYKIDGPNGFVIVSHWGKIPSGWIHGDWGALVPSATGQCKVEPYSWAESARARFDSLIREKSKRGYSFEGDASFDIPGASLRESLMPAFGDLTSEILFFVKGNTFVAQTEDGAPMKSKASKPEEPARGEEWGSW